MRFYIKHEKDDGLEFAAGIINAFLLLFYFCLFLFVVFFILPSFCHASLLFPNVSADLKNMQNSTEKKLSDITAELGVIKGNQTTIDNKINVGFSAMLQMRNELNADIGTMKNSQATLSAQIKPIIKLGYDRSQNTETNAGRDISVTNDTGLLKTIIGALISTIASLFGVIILLIMRLTKSVNEKKEYKSKYYEVAQKVAAVTEVVKNIK